MNIKQSAPSSQPNVNCDKNTPIFALTIFTPTQLRLKQQNFCNFEAYFLPMNVTIANKNQNMYMPVAGMHFMYRDMTVILCLDRPTAMFNKTYINKPTNFCTFLQK